MKKILIMVIITVDIPGLLLYNINTKKGLGVVIMGSDARPLRSTHQRRLVKEIVLRHSGHPIAEEVYEIAREQDPTISKGTVYRNLGVLADIGEIRHLPMPMGPDHFDFNLDNHYHFICRICYKVVDAELPYNSRLNETHPGMPGYRTEWHRLVLVGLCPDCEKKQEEVKEQ